MSTEQMAELIEKLSPEKRMLVQRLIEALGEPTPAAPASDAGDVGILKHIGKYHLGGIVGSLTAEELHGDG
ncbi:MAG: hypothetical protein JXB32_08845 [Deltaproteobacteria bacterium]|nr:hypothetical protein [Deltaproteobacteria bacterium]